MQERGFIPFELQMEILAVRASSEFLQTSRDIHGAPLIFRLAEAPWYRAERLRSRDGPVSDYLIFGFSSQWSRATACALRERWMYVSYLYIGHELIRDALPIEYRIP
jgi:hypothetical protein